VKNANIFRRKLGKIAENCDHNIDPWNVLGRRAGKTDPSINFRNKIISTDGLKKKKAAKMRKRNFTFFVKK
jgi:hypothetical protein